MTTPTSHSALFSGMAKTRQSRTASWPRNTPATMVPVRPGVRKPRSSPLPSRARGYAGPLPSQGSGWWRNPAGISQSARPMMKLRARMARRDKRGTPTSGVQEFIESELGQLPRVLVRAKEVQGDIGLLAHHPAVVRNRWNVEEVPGMHLDYPVLESDGGHSGHHQAQVFHPAATRAGDRPHVLRPFPSRLVGGSPNAHPIHPHDLEPAF